MLFFPLYKCVDNVSVNGMKRLFVAVFVEFARTQAVVWHFVSFFLSKCVVVNRKSI